MRTTLTIDDDVLVAVKAIASAQHQSIGEVISVLSRQALTSTRNGIPLLPIQKNGLSI